jgi:hypothetical protein
VTLRIVTSRTGEAWRVGRRWLCPHCSTDVRSPYSKSAEENAELRHGSLGRSYCPTCEDYIAPLEVIYVGPGG